MFRKALIPFLVVAALLVTLAPLGHPPAPAHAQDDGQTDTFALSIDALVAELNKAGQGNDRLEYMVTPDMQKFQEGGSCMPLNTTVRSGDATMIVATTFCPITLERGIRWDVASWSVMTEDGTEVDDPPRMVGKLVNRLKRGWARSTMDALKQNVRGQYPDGLPGQPQLLLPYIEQANLMFEIDWGDGSAETASSLPDDLMQGERAFIGETEKNLTYFIDQQSINATFSQWVQNGNDAPSLQFEIQMIQSDNDAPSLLQFEIQMLQFEIQDLFIYARLTLEDSNGQTVSLQIDYGLNEAFTRSEGQGFRLLGPPGSNLNFEEIKITFMDGDIENGEAIGQQASRIAAQAMNRYLAAQINFAEVSDLTVVDGGIEVTVLRPEEE
jgi:hypothetical protein